MHVSIRKYKIFYPSTAVHCLRKKTVALFCLQKGTENLNTTFEILIWSILEIKNDCYAVVVPLKPVSVFLHGIPCFETFSVFSVYF